MNTIASRLQIGSVLLLLATSLYAYEALQGPTELLYWDKTNAYNGYTWFGVRGTTYLVDMEGRVVHTWPVGTNPHVLTNGNVLDANNNDPSGFLGFTEVNWNGSNVWSYSETRTNYSPHHDFLRIFNPKLNAFTTLYMRIKRSAPTSASPPAAIRRTDKITTRLRWTPLWRWTCPATSSGNGGFMIT